MSIETDCLIVGTGPAGGSLACFLASHGIEGIAISTGAGSVSTPRAHVANQASLECLRDIGLEETTLKVATPYSVATQVITCHSLAGQEFGRVPLMRNGPTMAQYHAASPCQHTDIPQNVLEPILVAYAARNGFNVRFNTSWLDYKLERDGRVVSTVLDNLTHQTYQITSKYLFACDGGRSKVVKQLDLPLNRQGDGGFAINVLFKADLAKHMENRPCLLAPCVQPGLVQPQFSAVSIARMVKPWKEWLVVLLPFPRTSIDIEPTKEAFLKSCRDLIGDDTIDIEILDVSKWVINQTVAEKYSEGNIFGLGDAVHRHPPHNGLGSNTSIQDSHNLAWKVAYVMKGLADPSILDSYSVERQPVGAGVIKRCMEAYSEDMAVYEALGMLTPDPVEQLKMHAELQEATAKGAARRQRLQAALDGTRNIYQGLGIELNQFYNGSAAVYTADEAAARPPLPDDSIKMHQVSTYPGSRLPHTWLNTTVPGKQISTQDLAGHGVFSLFTGIGGDAWRDAAARVSKVLGAKIKVWSVGWRQDYEDVYWDWASRREVEEDGCLLIRPDRFVAWMAMKMVESPEAKLEAVMRHVLGRPSKEQKDVPKGLVNGH